MVQQRDRRGNRHRQSHAEHLRQAAPQPPVGGVSAAGGCQDDNNGSGPAARGGGGSPVATSDRKRTGCSGADRHVHPRVAAADPVVRALGRVVLRGARGPRWWPTSWNEGPLLSNEKATATAGKRAIRLRRPPLSWFPSVAR